MDLYTTAFNIPRSAGSTASYAHDNSAPSPALSTLDFARADPPAPPARSASQLHLAEAPTTGKIGSMRSRFSPSVKAFMPSAFGGKRGGDRIAEVTALGAEKADGEGADAGNVQSPSSAWHDGRAPPVLEEGQSVSAAMAAIKNRDSRSTVGTRSSLDFSSAASFSADSTAPSTTGGDRSLGHDKRDSLPGQAGHRSQSEPPSASHSASASISAIGPNASQSSADLAEAMQRLSVDVMANHQCLVTFTPIQSDENQTSDALVQAFPRQGSYPQYPGPGQLPFPTNGLPPPGYPYQQYHPQTYGQDGSSGFGSGLFGTGLIGAPGLPSPIGTIGSAKGQQPQQQEQAKPKSPQFNFHLSGGYQQVMSARGALLRENPFRTRSAVKVPRADVLDSAPGSPPGTEALKPDVRRRLDDIALATRAHIAIMSTEAHGADLGYGLETERNVELVISGPFESVEQARVRLLVLLDELVSPYMRSPSYFRTLLCYSADSAVSDTLEQSGLHSDTCEIDYKLHNIIGGRKRCVIQTIQEETATNIYFPTPFSGVLGSNRNPTVLAKQNTVHITGEFFGVQRARDMLFQVSMHKVRTKSLWSFVREHSGSNIFLWYCDT